MKMSRLFCLIILGVTCVPLAAEDYVLHAGKLIDVETGTVREGVTITVTGKRITAIEDGYAPAGAGELVDLRGHTVMPGLMDMHTHVSVEYSPQIYSERFFMDQAAYALRAAVYTEKTLLAGFTTVRDLGEIEPGVSLALREAINKGYIKGPRIYTSGVGLATTGGHSDHSNGLRRELMGDPGPADGVINGPEDAYQAVRQRYKEGVDVIKLSVTGGVLSLAASGDNPQFTDEELAAVMKAAADYQFVVAVHAHGTEGMKRAIRAGVHSVEHGTYMDDEAIRLMKKHGTYYVPTLSAGRWVAMKSTEAGYYPEIVRAKAAAIGPQIMETFARARNAGVRIAFGTDAGVFPHGQNAAEFGYMVEAGMPPMEAIRSATVEAARLLRVENDLGSVEPGKLADIIAVPGDPLSDISLMQQITFVMKDGQIYKHEQQRDRSD